MAECIVGDITPWDGVTKEEKHRREEVSNYKMFLFEFISPFIVLGFN